MCGYIAVYMQIKEVGTRPCCFTFIHIACSIESLGSSLDVHLDEVCLSTDIGSVSVVNGTGCYSGTTAGSVATYHCDNGYIISSGSEQRECRSDGNWEGEIPVCKEGIILHIKFRRLVLYLKCKAVINCCRYNKIPALLINMNCCFCLN